MKKRKRQLPTRRMGIRNGSGEVSRADLAGQVSSRDADKVETGRDGNRQNRQKGNSGKDKDLRKYQVYSSNSTYSSFSGKQ